MLRFVAFLLSLLCLGSGFCAPAATPTATAPAASDSAPVLSEDLQRVLDAREALRKRDRARLAAHRAAFAGSGHLLTPWIDYWELSNRLNEVSQAEIEAFYARWPGSYVEDRLRNDWLLELGRRRDWRAFALDYPRFRMNDDREVHCYSLLTRAIAGEDVRAAARSAWLAQREADEGCQLLAASLVEARHFGEAEIWARARQGAELNRPRVAKQALGLLTDVPPASVITELAEQPLRYLSKRNEVRSRQSQELAALALARLAGSEPAQVAALLEERWQALLPADSAAWVWAVVGRQGALKLLPEAEGWFQRAAQLGARKLEWSDEQLGWRARAALRAADPGRWARVLEAIDLMSSTEQRDPTWAYWKARALLASAASGPAGEAQRSYARELLQGLTGQLNFYGKLASEDLGQSQRLPPRPAPASAEERARAEQNPGLNRALLLLAIGLRSEGVREWNYSVRELSDRDLLAAAQRACEREVWDRCIQASERTRSEIDLATRFPTPFRTEVLNAAREMNLDPAYVYGLIRQESRFVSDIRSSVGASGLMQLMPATAKWTARKLGLSYSPEQITERGTNLRLGTGYLKLVLDDLDGSLPMAAAAYNAGPNRLRRWRDGPTLDVAVWIENIPFNETRDYVKKVLSNTSYYSAILAGQNQATLRNRLGNTIGPRPPEAVPENRDLP